MSNGIGRVWAANAGDDEQRPNGVGSVWIENIDSLAPSGGASEEQINELSAAIDYVSANAGTEGALTSNSAQMYSFKNGRYISFSSDLGITKIDTDPYDTYDSSSLNGRVSLNIQGVSGFDGDISHTWCLKENDLTFGISDSQSATTALKLSRFNGLQQENKYGDTYFNGQFNYNGIKISAGYGNTLYHAIDISNGDIKTSSYNNTATYSLTSMAQTSPKSGDFLNTKKYISFGSQGAVLADKFERISAVSSYETSFTKVGTLNSATEGVSAVNEWYTTVTFPITAISDKETFKANWKYNASTGTFYVLNEPYNDGYIPPTGTQVYSGDFKIENGKTDSFYVTGLTPDEEYYVYLFNIGYNQSANIDVDYGTSTFGSATMYMDGIVVPDNDTVNAMASDLTAMSAALPTTSQLLPYPMAFVSTSSEATGTNILYVVTGTGE